MRQIAILIAFMVALAAMGQTDSAESVVGRYMATVNYDALPQGETLSITSKAVCRAKPGDTIEIKRWYAAPNNYRVEVRQRGILVEGWHNKGHEVFRKFDTAKIAWVDASEIHYYDHVTGYDFRGVLYHRKNNGSVMRYEGALNYNGHPIYKVSAQTPEMYDRDYFFEAESGLLFLFTEKNTSYGEETLDEDNHIDWKSIDEYLPVGEMLIIGKETYQHHGTRTTVVHTAQLTPTDWSIFEKD